jgi:hypothetical protein
MKRKTIATLDGIFVLNELTGFYEPQTDEPENHGRWPLLHYAFLAVAVIAIGYCIAKAIHALA